MINICTGLRIIINLAAQITKLKDFDKSRDPSGGLQEHTRGWKFILRAQNNTKRNIRHIALVLLWIELQTVTARKPELSNIFLIKTRPRLSKT